MSAQQGLPLPQPAAFPCVVENGSFRIDGKLYGDIGPAFYGLRTMLPRHVLMGCTRPGDLPFTSLVYRREERGRLHLKRIFHALQSNRISPAPGCAFVHQAPWNGD